MATQGPDPLQPITRNCLSFPGFGEREGVNPWDAFEPLLQCGETGRYSARGDVGGVMWGRDRVHLPTIYLPAVVRWKIDRIGI